MTTFLLVRHGAFDGLGRVVSGRIPGVGLNASGRAQSRRLAERLADRSIAAIYSSPLQRALDTAAIVGQALSLPIQVEPDLREVDFGRWTDHQVDDLLDDATFRAFNQQRVTTRIPDGELMLEVQARALSALLRLAAHHRGHALVAVTHADVIRSIVAGCLGISLDAMLRLSVDPASVSEVGLGEAAPTILRMNDTAHLVAPAALSAGSGR